MTTQLTNDLTYIAFEAIIRHKKALNDLYFTIQQCCGDFDDGAAKLRNYFNQNNPFHLLEITNPASALYWAATDHINYYELAQQLSDYFNSLPLDDIPF